MPTYIVNPDTQFQHALFDTPTSAHAGTNVLKHFFVSIVSKLLNVGQTVLFITILSAVIYFAFRAAFVFSAAAVSRIRSTALQYGPKKLKVDDDLSSHHNNSDDIEAQYDSVPDLVSTPSSIGSPISIGSPGLMSPAAMNDALKKLGVYSTGEYYTEFVKNDVTTTPKIVSSLYPSQQHPIIKTH